MEYRAQKLAMKIIDELKKQNMAYIEILDSWMDSYHSLSYKEREELPKRIEEIVKQKLPSCKVEFRQDVVNGVRYLMVSKCEHDKLTCFVSEKDLPQGHSHDDFLKTTKIFSELMNSHANIRVVRS